MAEEQRCETSEGHRLCANNCGFFGSPATMNLCSKCFRDFCLKEQQEAATKSTIETALSSSSTHSPAVESLPPPPPLKSPEVAAEAPISEVPAAAAPELLVAQPNRCATCRKRVGFTGFKCRCGITFCGAHRYPEKHGCDFDFKAVGREEISRANPVVIAEKLRKI